MPTKTFKCRWCDHTESTAHALKSHYKTGHKRAYEKWQADKAAARAESAAAGGGHSEPDGDAEASLLFALNAEFATARESGLDDTACGRVLTYLRDRWAPASAVA